MGHRVTQTIYTCAKCNIIPDNGEKMWWMGNEIWCEQCCNNDEKPNDQ